MGVTIKSQNYSIDIGYSNFFNLRCLIARSISEEIGKLYKDLAITSLKYNVANGNDYFDKLANQYSIEFQKYPSDLHLTHNFLWAEDCGGKRSWKTCEQILNLLQDQSNDIKIGYLGWGDKCATLGQFKEILQDCVDNHGYMQWY